MVGDVEGDEMEPGIVKLREEAGGPFRLEVRQRDRGDFRVLKQIEGTGAALQAGAEYEHLHWVVL